jgi:ubiquinone/menaquinone biosynthesis C-methylase UbiE
MVKAAKESESCRDEYCVADAQDMRFIGEENFDLAISYLNQCDLPDFGANNREVLRVLRSGGRFIVANIHPMRSAVGFWQKTDDGTKRHVILESTAERIKRRGRAKLAATKGR